MDDEKLRAWARRDMLRMLAAKRQGDLETLRELYGRVSAFEQVLHSQRLLRGLGAVSEAAEAVEADDNEPVYLSDAQWLDARKKFWAHIARHMEYDEPLDG